MRWPSMNRPADMDLKTVSMWINGKPIVPAGRMGDVFNPALGRVAKCVPYADVTTVDAAVTAATAAYPGWRDTPLLRRARVMQRFQQLLGPSQGLGQDRHR